MRFLVICLMVPLMIGGCFNKFNKTFYNISIFDGTDVEKLSKYVAREDTEAINSFIINHKEVDIDTPDPYFGESLLSWSIFNGKYDSFLALLKNNANPNHVGGYNGFTPLCHAAQYIDNNYQTDDRYLAKLLDYGADPYLKTKDTVNNSTNNVIVYASYHLPYLKILVERCGVDVNYTVGEWSLVCETIVQRRIESAHYLVVIKGAKMDSSRGEERYSLINLVKEWICTDEYEEKMKKEIIECYYKQHPEERDN